MMMTRAYRIRFLTPAFLGDFEQKGAWRTPPFKALLRQWWRVAHAAQHGFSVDVDAMRREEGALFGAVGKTSAQRSAVRLRLDRWTVGTLTSWTALGPVKHPEVPRPMDASLYLGYGPIDPPRGQQEPTLRKRAAIQADESTELRLAFPDHAAPAVDTALWLLDRYATVGGRSRNGWGSFLLEPAVDTPALQASLPSRPWRDALSIDWPHAIGCDEAGPLVWQSGPFDNWSALMHRLAEVKIALRTQFKFPNASPDHQRPLDRHWLSYPVTNHTVKSWGRNARLPNSLRFKARFDADGKLRGTVFHVPCLPPEEFRPERAAIERVWNQVYRHLDSSTALHRTAA